jgi:hypothetical protein
MTDPIWKAARAEFERKGDLTRGDLQTLLRSNHNMSLSEDAVKSAVRKWSVQGRIKFLRNGHGVFRMVEGAQ